MNHNEILISIGREIFMLGFPFTNIFNNDYDTLFIVRTSIFFVMYMFLFDYCGIYYRTKTFYIDNKIIIKYFFIVQILLWIIRLSYFIKTLNDFTICLLEIVSIITGFLVTNFFFKFFFQKNNS